MNLEVVAVWLVVAMAPFATFNAVIYGVAFPWRRSREGRAFLNLLASLDALILGALLYMFVPAFPGKQIVAVTIYAAILAGCVQISYSFAQLLAERCRKSHADR